MSARSCLVEREVVIAELSGLLPTLEEARVEALRQAEDASAALVRTEAQLSEQAARVTALQGQLATVEADTAARERLLADLEARLAEERAERANERAEARRQAEEGAAAMRLSESRLFQEKKRVETLEQELETLEAALARHVAGLSELEATVSQVRSEHEEVKPPSPPTIRTSQPARRASTILASSSGLSACGMRRVPSSMHCCPDPSTPWTCTSATVARANGQSSKLMTVGSRLRPESLGLRLRCGRPGGGFPTCFFSRTINRADVRSDVPRSPGILGVFLRPNNPRSPARTTRATRLETRLALDSGSRCGCPETASTEAVRFTLAPGWRTSRVA